MIGLKVLIHLLKKKKKKGSDFSPGCTSNHRHFNAVVLTCYGFYSNNSFMGTSRMMNPYNVSLTINRFLFNNETCILIALVKLL